MRRPFARFETAQVGRGQQRVGEVRQIVHRVRATAAAGRAAFLAPRTYQGLRTVDDPDDRQHHRHFDQHADDRRQGRAGVEAEQAYRGGHGQFEEVAGSDQRRRTCDAMLFAGETVQQIGEARVEIDLDDDRHGQQQNDDRLRDDPFALEAEQRHQRRQQGDERRRLQRREQTRERRRSAVRQQGVEAVAPRSPARRCRGRPTRPACPTAPLSRRGRAQPFTSPWMALIAHACVRRFGVR
jgi:hypothetical protein